MCFLCIPDSWQKQVIGGVNCGLLTRLCMSQFLTDISEEINSSLTIDYVEYGSRSALKPLEYSLLNIM